MKTLNKLIEFIMYAMPVILIIGGFSLILYTTVYGILHIDVICGNTLIPEEGSSMFIHEKALHVKLWLIGLLSIPLGLAWRRWTVIWYEVT